MSRKIHDVGAAKQIGKYSDTIETAAGLRWLHPSGTPGDGTVPEGVEAQPVSPGTPSLLYCIGWSVARKTKCLRVASTSKQSSACSVRNTPVRRKQESPRPESIRRTTAGLRFSYSSECP
jgi:hypothetical protein